VTTTKSFAHPSFPKGVQSTSTGKYSYTNPDIPEVVHLCASLKHAVAIAVAAARNNQKGTT
jgi:hypothetical protein